MATSTDELNPVQLASLLDTANQRSFRSAGAGNPYALYQTILSQYDRFGINPLLPNHEVVGFTFITRPKLNFSTTSLRQDRILSLLDTVEAQSLQYAIRCYLDTRLSRQPGFDVKAAQCPFFNDESPFIIPLTNNLVSMSGWPDPVLDTETTDGGYYSEDMTMVKGSDRLSRTYDFTLTFRDIQGGFILSLLYFWIRYIELVVRGDTTAYPEDIDARRINYTCSIYRFVMDPSRQFITKWAKATGCFPKSIPLGNAFNFGENEKFIHSSAQYSVPFTVNKVELMDPIIFRDFNTISKRFSPTLRNATDVVFLDNLADHNFIGLPIVDTNYNRLRFVANRADLADPAQANWDQLRAAVQALGTAPTPAPQTPTRPHLESA